MNRPSQQLSWIGAFVCFFPSRCDNHAVCFLKLIQEPEVASTIPRPPSQAQLNAHLGYPTTCYATHRRCGQPRRPEHGQSLIAFVIEEARISIVDDMLKPCSRPAQDHHLGHQLAMVPIWNAWLEYPKANRDLLSLQASKVVVVFNPRLKTMLRLQRGGFDDHSISMC